MAPPQNHRNKRADEEVGITDADEEVNERKIIFVIYQ